MSYGQYHSLSWGRLITYPFIDVIKQLRNPKYLASKFHHHASTKHEANIASVSTAQHHVGVRTKGILHHLRQREPHSAGIQIQHKYRETQ